MLTDMPRVGSWTYSIRNAYTNEEYKLSYKNDIYYFSIQNYSLDAFLVSPDIHLK